MLGSGVYLIRLFLNLQSTLFLYKKNFTDPLINLSHNFPPIFYKLNSATINRLTKPPASGITPIQCNHPQFNPKTLFSFNSFGLIRTSLAPDTSQGQNANHSQLDSSYSCCKVSFVNTSTTTRLISSKLYAIFYP